MHIAKSLYHDVKHTYVQSHIPTVVYDEWIRIKDINGRTTKSTLLESMVDFITKYNGKTEFDIFTRFD